LSGSFSIRNPHLEALLVDKAKNSDNIWNSILEKGGSVQHLDFLSVDEKDCFKTSFEIDQRWLLELSADRTPYIDQAQSLNLFIPADVEKWDLLMLHYRAWELGIKSLYYLRSKSVQRAGFAGGVEADNTAEAPVYELATTDYDVNVTYIALAAVFFALSAAMTAHARKAAEEPGAKKSKLSGLLFMIAGTGFVLAGVMPMLRSL
ncbi:MAG: hypothetical protein ACREXP_32425, partial [Steroidobacteraceae bacterium]